MEFRVRQMLMTRSNVFKALAHPTRLFIVEELAKERRCVGDLTALVKADASTVSKHLSILKQAGIVHDEKAGVQVFYELTMPCVLTFFSCIDAVVTERAEFQLTLSRESL